MQRRGQIFLLGCLLAFAVSASLAFNIDTKNADVYVGEEKDFFGYKVLQYKYGTNKGIIVTAPLQKNGTGGVCKLDQHQTNKCFNPEDVSLPNGTVPVKNFGLSIARDPINSSFTICSPSLGHECYENSYLNSICYKISPELQQLSSFKPSFQECTKKVVNLVFLFDGSGSMLEDEFTQNKVFIKDIMTTLNSTSIKFAAVQFSSDYRKVFDFNDLRDTALDKLKKEIHMKTLTNTHKALKYVLEGLFENPASGADADATQVVVLITDGDPSDSDKLGIIERYDNKAIIRFVIGVKKAKLDKFRAIASEPKDKNAFQIEDYNGLTGLLENLQKKVFNLEGSKVARAGNMINEMSQSGFSAAFHRDTLILGSVGTNTWKGSLQNFQGQTMTQIEDSDMETDSYMGYSVSVGERKKALLYFSGAPRYNHTGQVVLFTQNGQKWIVAQRINGDQFGSYFGAELCSVDMDSDGDTDFLLVGAPLFFQPSENKEGQIYVYTLTDERKLKEEMVVGVASMGRFGTAISSLADLNGDKLRDVAVGAPLEDENRGAVYIYLGDKNKGIRSTFSQRITGQKIKPQLRRFGQAIDGGMDLGEDGLTDIVVGSQGMAVVLSSKPVFDVIATLTFSPEEISTDRIDCLSYSDEILPMVTVRACFKKMEATKRKSALSSGLNITYSLDVDPMRQQNRGFFNLDKKARNISSTYGLMDEETCFNFSVYMPKCVKDTLSPIPIKLHFSQDDSETASTILNVDSIRRTTVEVPFEKHCRGNDTCIAELEVDFEFMTPTLLVTEDNYFNVTIVLSNRGDDSYNTSLTMHYPPGLSFSRMTLIKWTRPTPHSCYDLDDVLDKTICGISRPVYHSQSVTTFQASFLVIPNHEWDDTISMTITGNSDNMNSTGTNSLTKSIPVQFEVKMAMTVSEDSITYMNFTTEDTAPKRLVAKYKIANIGSKDFLANVSLFFPTKLEHNFEMENYRVVVQENQTECADIGDMKSEYCSGEKKCKIISCETFILEKDSAVEFELSGDVQFKDLAQHAGNIAFFKKYIGDNAEVKFKSFLHVDYDKERYVLNAYKQEEEFDKTGQLKNNDPALKWTEVRVEFIIPPNQIQIISTGVGLGLLLLFIITIIMFKLGCFKRKTLEDYQAEDAALQAGTSNESIPFPANGTGSRPETGDDPEQPLEEKGLLHDDGDAGSPNESTPLPNGSGS